MGDGGIGYQPSEFETAVGYGLLIIVIVGNDEVEQIRFICDQAIVRIPAKDFSDEPR